MSPIDYTEMGGDPDEVFLPKQGERATITILSMERVDAEKSRKNFKSQEENFGFHYRLNLGGKHEGKFSILNVFKLFECFKEQNVQDGDTIEIDHFGRAKYKVTKVEESAASTTPSAEVGAA